MGALSFSLLAAGCASLSSLCFRKNVDGRPVNYSPSGYLLFFFFLPLILSFAISADLWNTKINFTILFMGCCVGVLCSTLMLLTFRALEQGPAGLTFAFQSASAVFPGLILFLLLGTDFGFACSSLQLIGMALVIIGLFLGAKNVSSNSFKASFKWLKYALACFFVQALALTIMQARCVLFDYNIGGWSASLTEADDVWFMPGQFGASFIMQAVIFLREKRSFDKREIVYGSLGGVANFSSTCLLLFATKLALPFEKGILFPCFAVTGMVLSNIWANKLYKEKFNLKANALCSLGIFMAVSG